MQKSCKKIWYFKKTPYLCNPERNVRRNAEIAQLVERNLAKVEVAGPSPVFRSKPQHIAEVFLYALLSPTSRELLSIKKKQETSKESLLPKHIKNNQSIIVRQDKSCLINYLTTIHTNSFLFSSSLLIPKVRNGSVTSCIPWLL